MTVRAACKQHLMAKPTEATCFALQFDETVKNDPELIMCCRFPDKSVEKIVEHRLLSSQLGCKLLGMSLFLSLMNFYQSENSSWKK